MLEFFIGLLLGVFFGAAIKTYAKDAYQWVKARVSK